MSAKEGDTARVLRWTGDQRHVLPALAFLALALGYLVGRWPMPTVLVFAVLALSIGTVWSHEFALGAILVSSLVMLGIISWFGLPGQASLVTKALIGLFALTVVLDLGPKNPLRVPTSLIMLVGVLAVSAAFGAGNRFLAFQALAAYVAGPVAYVAIVHSTITMRSLKRLALVVLAVVVAQAPIVIVQARFAASVDRIGGTFGAHGGTGLQAVVMAFAWTIAVALLFGRKRVWLLPVGLAIAAVLLISEAKAGFVLAALGTIAVGLTKAVANPRHRAIVLLQYGAIGAAALAVLFGAYVYVGSLLPGGQAMARYWLAWMTDPAAIMTYMFSYGPGGQAGRLEGARLVLNQSRTIADLLIGRGLGLLSSSALLGQTGMSSGFSGTFDWTTSVTRSLLETGLLGTLLYLVAIGSACGAVVRSWTSRSDELGVAVGAAAVGSAAVYVAAALYANPWFVDATAVLFWCLLGMAVKWGCLRQVEPGSKRDLGASLSPASTA